MSPAHNGMQDHNMFLPNLDAPHRIMLVLL